MVRISPRPNQQIRLLIGTSLSPGRSGAMILLDLRPEASGELSFPVLRWPGFAAEEPQRRKPLKPRIPALSAGATLILTTLLAGSAAVSSAAAPASSWDEPKAAWRNGPVRYLLTSDEDKAYKALKTDEERAKAIADFWARRDPTPGTPANEYRDDFYRRVEEANKEFKESSTTGWTTDRGRVLLVAGYPKDRKPEEEQETWSYENLVAGLEPIFAAADEAAAKSPRIIQTLDPGARA